MINTFNNKDVFDFLSTIDDESIDLLLTDPPYNMSKEKWDTFKNDDEFFKFTFDWIDICVKKLKKDGSLYIFNNSYNSAFILTHLVSIGMHFKNSIIWNKRDGIGSSKKRYCNTQETILFFTKDKSNHTFNADDIRIPYESTDRMKHASKKGIIKNGKRWFPNENGKLCPDVLHFSSERHNNKVNGRVVKMGHITPKPKALIEVLIKASSNCGDIVMDPFAGIGTTGLVANYLNRNFICNDFTKEYVYISENSFLEQKNRGL